MNAEEFIRLFMDQGLGVDQSTIDKHFEKFKNKFRKIPIVSHSLQNEVMDRDGNVLDITDINQCISDLKNKFQNPNPEFMNFILYILRSLMKLFLYEIELHIDFAKDSFAEYKEQKEHAPIDVKKAFKNIHHFSVHVANISKLLEQLKTPTNSLKSELFSPILEKIDLELFSLRALRNHLEHFGERLDAWHYVHFGEPLFDMNTVDSSTTGLNITNCLRIFDFEKDTIYILGEEFDLKNIFEAVIRIEDVLKNIQIPDPLPHHTTGLRRMGRRKGN